MGLIFKTCAAFLKLDAEYVKNYETCLKTFLQLKATNKKFQKIVTEFEVSVDKNKYYTLDKCFRPRFLFRSNLTKDLNLEIILLI